MEPKVLILHRSDAGYAGMDRHRLDLAPDVPEALSSRAADLETLDVDAAVAEARVLVRQLPTDRWEIIIVGGPIRDDTEHLGYDVGETLDACWSAIRHADVFLDAKANARWQARRNQHDLFFAPADADEYLELYLASDDPDKGWSENGWKERPGWYAVLSVQRVTSENPLA
ncbi:hypothetical protein [Haliangium ochraceum]|uniref:Uncharacterized protein n=1 Tax=Haliangium ochraceum (strain DSM 14365 / JCM 11303 / SMP-2) TaxID=502025 RepID=D0LMU9_HALO1|nr:hypothetical protein [Haliangium ochraceum]ACY13320.1 hypothetical protein Hoch_0690 [Haliangium ochraceum DSM 14365]